MVDAIRQEIAVHDVLLSPKKAYKFFTPIIVTWLGEDNKSCKGIRPTWSWNYQTRRYEFKKGAVTLREPENWKKNEVGVKVDVNQFHRFPAQINLSYYSNTNIADELRDILEVRNKMIIDIWLDELKSNKKKLTIDPNWGFAQ